MNAGQILIAVLIDLLITAAAYLLVPLILILSKKMLSDKAIKIIAIVNAVVVAVLFVVLGAVLGSTEVNVVPALLWGSIGYALMKKYC